MQKTEATSEAETVARNMVEALRDNRLDEAQSLLNELNVLKPEVKDFLIFPVLIAIQRGQVREALQLVNDQPEDSCPELKALCLYILEDPSWQGIAESLEDSGDANVRQAMRQLLGRPVDANETSSMAAAA